MAVNIPTTEELKGMFDDLKAMIKDTQRNTGQSLASDISVGWQDTNKICADTGIDRSTLFLYKSREWLVSEKDYYQLGRKYYWRVESVRQLLSGQKILPKESWD